MKSVNGVISAFGFLLLVVSSQAGATVACKKLKVTDFQQKAVQIIDQLAKTQVINKSSFTFNASGGKPLKLSPNCVDREAYVDDGGSRCAFKCSVENEESIYITLYENFRGQPALLDIKREINH